MKYRVYLHNFAFPHCIVASFKYKKVLLQVQSGTMVTIHKMIHFKTNIHKKSLDINKMKSWAFQSSVCNYKLTSKCRIKVI